VTKEPKRQKSGNKTINVQKQKKTTRNSQRPSPSQEQEQATPGVDKPCTHRHATLQVEGDAKMMECVLKAQVQVADNIVKMHRKHQKDHMNKLRAGEWEVEEVLGHCDGLSLIKWLNDGELSWEPTEVPPIQISRRQIPLVDKVIPKVLNNTTYGTKRGREFDDTMPRMKIKVRKKEGKEDNQTTPTIPDKEEEIEWSKKKQQKKILGKEEWELIPRRKRQPHLLPGKERQEVCGLKGTSGSGSPRRMITKCLHATGQSKKFKNRTRTSLPIKDNISVPKVNSKSFSCVVGRGCLL